MRRLGARPVARAVPRARLCERGRSRQRRPRRNGPRTVPRDALFRAGVAGRRNSEMAAGRPGTAQAFPPPRDGMTGKPPRFVACVLLLAMTSGCAAPVPGGRDRPTLAVAEVVEAALDVELTNHRDTDFEQNLAILSALLNWQR